MNKYWLSSISLLSLLVIGCASNDDVAAVGRAAVNTGLAVTAVALGAPMLLENCDLKQSEYDRGQCLRRNSEIKAAKER